MFSITLNVHYLRSLRHIMAQKDIRYYLNGAAVECDSRGKFYVATDGHRLVVYFEEWADGEEPQEFKIIVPGDVVKAIKPHRTLDCGILRELEGGRWILEAGNAQVFTPIDGKFPDWARVIPATASGEPGDYKNVHLSDFDKCTAEGMGAMHPCKIYQNGAGSAPVLSSCGPQFIGVVMPLRSGCPSDYAAPAWMKAQPAAPAEVPEGASRFRGASGE